MVLDSERTKQREPSYLFPQRMLSNALKRVYYLFSPSNLPQKLYTAQASQLCMLR